MTPTPSKNTEPKQPDFLGIGSLKAGTTWLSEQLSAHPDIYLPPIKETHFFGYPYPEYPFFYYSSFFADAQSHQTIGEFSADYLETPEVPM
ncbi:MAG: hypothetical protein J6386_05415 [Candidatus Synoicihabitans palmerolidicus]|nr:hypothetical protein [Candidatus Synoicihabitans palmerolidicus]